MKTTICVFLLSLVTSVFGQDHAPTVEQCRADQHLWSDQLQNDRDEISKLSFRQITGRSEEMADCISVDRERAMHYSIAVAGFSEHLMSRMYNFIKRHELLDQFKAEDAAGKR